MIINECTMCGYLEVKSIYSGYTANEQLLNVSLVDFLSVEV